MAESFRRGFKAECEQVAVESRAELGLGVAVPLRAVSLAEHLGIPVLAMTELGRFGASDQDIRRAQNAVSAFTVIRGTYKTIFFNPAHPLSRLANSLAHELSHILLEHTPEVAILDGHRNWNPYQESEADWLAATLLVPREGARRWLQNGGVMTSGASHFQVSDALFRWRVNQTGVARQLRLTG